MAVITPLVLHYMGIALAVCLSAFGVALGQGMAGGCATEALSRQELGHSPVRKGLLLGLIFIESGGIFALVTAIMFFVQGTDGLTMPMARATFGACICVGIAAAVVGFSLGRVSQEGYAAIARQPLLSVKVTQMMILTQILLETISVFAFVMAILIRARLSPTLTEMQGWQCFFGALMVGLGAIGPALGQARFSSAACRAVGLNMGMYGRIFSYALIAQVIVETPIVFSVIMGMLMSMKTISVTPLFEACAAMAGAVIAFSVGAIGASRGCGNVGANAVLAMARKPVEHGSVFRTALLSKTIIETAVVYSLIISFLLFTRCQ